ncbi:hypothetical protein MJL33_28205, partial [Salmonella enterica subsp. enterica serovar Kentucky]|nr:hypothetical protein [Salmonella enterica subsp. enterica serovar Kentucky]
RVISNTVNRLMRARHIDATVADFLSALVRYGVIAFTLIAALGRAGTLCGKNKDIPGSTRKGCKTCPDTLWFTLMPFLLSFVVEVA